MIHRRAIRGLSLAACPLVLAAQAPTIEEYEPRTTLVVPQHPTPRAKSPFIDVHGHPRAGGKLLAEMDQMNLRVMVVLFGGSGDRLKRSLEVYRALDPNRFVLFANLDWSGISEPGWGARAAAQLEQDVKTGAVGLKIHKNFGMDLKYRDGRRVPVDDPLLDPVFQACGRLQIPVVIHTGDPRTHFEPVDKFNERWIELKTRPGRSRSDEELKWETLIAERDRMFARHPKTTFIAAHLGWHAGDLGALGRLFDRLPNVYGECGAVLTEIGRQPFTAHDFFVKYQDRLLFGKDSYVPAEYPYYFRVFETRDEYFDYAHKRHGLWKMYGLGLPDEVLKKLYYKNATRIIPGISASQLPN